MGATADHLLGKLFSEMALGGVAPRTAVASDELITPEWASQLARDRSNGVRRALAANPAVPHDVLRSLAAGSADQVVDAALATNPSTPADVLVALHERCPQVYLHPKCPPQLLSERLHNERLHSARPDSASSSAVRRTAILCHPNLPEEDLLAVIDDEVVPAPAVLGAAPLSAQTRRHLIDALAAPSPTGKGHPSVKARCGLWVLCRNPTMTGGEILRVLALLGPKHTSVALWELAANPACPSDILARIEAVRGDDAGTAARLATNPSTSPATLRAMVDNGRPWGDLALANPNCPAGLVHQVLDRRAANHTHTSGAARSAHVRPGDVPFLLNCRPLSSDTALLNNHRLSDECLAAAAVERPAGPWASRPHAGPLTAAVTAASAMTARPLALLLDRLGLSVDEATVAWGLRSSFDGTVAELAAAARSLVR